MAHSTITNQSQSTTEFVLPDSEPSVLRIFGNIYISMPYVAKDLTQLHVVVFQYENIITKFEIDKCDIKFYRKDYTTECFRYPSIEIAVYIFGRLINNLKAYY